MMNKERLTIEEQLEEIKECGSKFNDAQYYCLYKYDIERIIPYIEDLQQRVDKAKDLSDEIYNFIKCRNSNLFYEIEDLLIKQDEILGGKNEDNNI